MSDLSPRARELIGKARESEQPSPADFERNLAALRARLGSAPPTNDNPPSPRGGPGAPVARGLTPWVSGAAVGLGLAVAIGFLALSQSSQERGESPHERAPLPAAPSTPAPANQRPEPTAPSEPLPLRDVEPAKQPRAPSTTPREPSVNATDRLAEEVRLLAQATSALSKGQAALSLRHLEEHQRLFPKGALSLERRAAKARALCLLGRTGEAEKELERLDSGSVQATRASEFCRSLKK